MKRVFSRRRNHNVWKGIAAGAIGGLVASWVMNQYQVLWSKASGRNGSEESSVTSEVAETVSERLLHEPLDESQKKAASPYVHYAFGTGIGAFYGGLAEAAPAATRGAGMPFGAAVWLEADELALPALGYAKSPTKMGLSTHAYALTSHLVYGLAAEGVRRLVRRVWK